MVRRLEATMDVSSPFVGNPSSQLLDCQVSEYMGGARRRPVHLFFWVIFGDTMYFLSMVAPSVGDGRCCRLYRSLY